MGSTYKEYTLDELGFIGRGKSKHRPRNDPSLFGGKYPFIQTGDVRVANLYITEFSETYNDVGLAQSQLWDKGTLLITIAANIAETAVLGIDACFPDSIVGFIPDESKVNAFYVKYYIDYIKQEMQSISQGTTQDNLSLEKLRTFKFKVPEKSKVDEITKILLGYDDLIGNNNRRIAILETIAQNFYREWFINFRFPGHEQAQWQETSQGKIPLGWKTTELGQLITVRRGKTITRKKAIPDGVPVVAGGLLPAYFHNVANTISPVITVSASGANAGYVNMYTIPVWASDCSYIDTETTPYVYYYYLLMKDRQVEITRMQTGAAQPHVYPKDLMRLEVLDVPFELLENFTEKITPIFNLMANLLVENDNLKQQRDLLLPRLIAG